MADVFLSYARPSLDDALRIADLLRASGYSVWFDQSLPAHRAYSDVIAEELDRAMAVLVLWSKDAAQSQWVRSEANRARETGRLVQLRLDDTRLPMPFDQIQCADLDKWTGDSSAAGWRTVQQSIAVLAGGEAGTAFARPAQAPAVDRRRLILAGGGAAVLAAGGFLAFREMREPQLPPEQRVLLQKGLDALQQFDALDAEQPGSAGNAIALLSKATEAVPQSAEAWGGLAMAYAADWRASSPAERPGLADRCRSAAERAFAIDRRDPRALASLRMIQPVYRNWQESERFRREALEMRRDFPINIFLMSDMLGSVGRWREAADLSMTADRSRFLIPGADRKVVVNLWSAGRLQEADEALRNAVDRWPEHPQVWRTRLTYLLFGGRPSDALTLLGDAANRPPAIPEGLVDVATATARVVAGGGDRDAAIAANLDYVAQTPAATPQVATALVAIGDPAKALELLRGYYFAEGPAQALAPPGGDADRITAQLFQPPMRPLWGKPPFEALLQRIGLTQYWRSSGIEPDYRRRP
jgi:tetratricopeptide (TPR) repeat protein